MERNEERGDVALIWGVRKIAKEIGRPEGMTLYLLRSGQIPARKVGGRWCTTRARIMSLFDEPVG